MLHSTYIILFMSLLYCRSQSYSTHCVDTVPKVPEILYEVNYTCCISGVLTGD